MLTLFNLLRHRGALFLLFSLTISTPSLATEEIPISVQFQNTPLSAIFDALAQYRSFHLISEIDLSRKMTIALHEVSWREAIQILCRRAQIDCQLEGDHLTIRASDRESLSSITPSMTTSSTPNRTQIYHEPKWIRVDHLPVNDVAQVIETTAPLSDAGEVRFIKEKGVVMVHDSEKRASAIRSLIDHLDEYPQQIHIAAHIVTMSDESLDEMGIHWGYTDTTSKGLSQLNLNLGVTNPSISAGFNIAKRKGNFLQLELSALEAENQVEIIASPNLMTSDQQTASIKQGSDIPYEVASGSNGNTTIEFKQAVLGLEVTPRLLKNGLIELSLIVTQNTAGQTIKKSDGGEALAIDTQEIRSKVIVQAGETVVLGGIFQQQNTHQVKGVPGLSQLPMVGGLFRYTGTSKQRRELVIFVTPTPVETLPTI